jgi:KDO2-lipid IV(A) lauroyltransferase
MSMEGFDYFDYAIELSRKKNIGVIVALPHIGSWEIAGAWLANAGYPPVVVAERLEPPELFSLFTKTRTDIGMEVIAHDDHPSAKLLTALNDGRFICLVADRDMSRKGTLTTFFGGKKRFPSGPAALALKTGAVILPICAYLAHDAKVLISYYPPIDPGKQTEDAKTEKIESITQQLADVFEDMIARDPSGWHVLADEWEKDE